jgi:hypothetical protein
MIPLSAVKLNLIERPTPTMSTSTSNLIQARASRRLPLAVKLGYTAFVAVLVPYYWMAYGPTNFLYFCDVALLMTVAAVWTENAILASAALVGIFLPQMLWVVDFLATAIGFPITGMTAYMFDAKLPLFVRFLSFFHFWLPFFLLWVVARLGYERRGFVAWSVVAWVLIVVGYALLPAPPAPVGKPWLPVNVNYVHGFSDGGPQRWMSPLVYLLVYAMVLQGLILWPTHRVMARILPRAPRG